MADSDRKPGTFTVTDRRSFDTTGDRKDDSSSAAEKPASGTTAPEGVKAPSRSRAEREAERSLPPADFATLVLSLGSAAMADMGEAPGPDGGKPTRNLPMAKHAIDLLSVLEEKTKGNLTAEEAQLLESLLFDLRLRYVEAIKPSAGTGSASAT
jgi:hypothetical protein